MSVEHHRDDRPPPNALLDDPALALLARWGRHFAETGLSPGASGNVSVRVSEGFVVTRTGVPLGAIERGDWVLVTTVERDARGLVVNVRGRHQPSQDVAVHAVLYERCKDAAAVFHLHVGRLDEWQSRLGIPATSTHYPAGSYESMAEIERFLDGHPDTRLFVLVDHGIVAWGGSVEETGELVEASREALAGGR